MVIAVLLGVVAGLSDALTSPAFSVIRAYRVLYRRAASGGCRRAGQRPYPARPAPARAVPGAPRVARKRTGAAAGNRRSNATARHRTTARHGLQHPDATRPRWRLSPLDRQRLASTAVQPGRGVGSRGSARLLGGQWFRRRRRAGAHGTGEDRAGDAREGAPPDASPAFLGLVGADSQRGGRCLSDAAGRRWTPTCS